MRFFSPSILSRLIVKLMVHSLWANAKDLTVISYWHETKPLLSMKDASCQAAQTKQGKVLDSPCGSIGPPFLYQTLSLAHSHRRGLHVRYACHKCNVIIRVRKHVILYTGYYKSFHDIFQEYMPHKLIDSRFFFYHKKS